MRNVLLFQIFLICLIVKLSLHYKIVVVSDSNDDQANYIGYINATINNFKASNLQVEFVDVSTLGNQSRPRICQSIEGNQAFVISLSQFQGGIDGVKQVYQQTAIPTVQIKYGPWVYKHHDLSTSEEYDTKVSAVDGSSATNYATFVQPSTVLLNFLRDLVEKINITEATILYDYNYNLDASLIAVLSNLPLGQRYLKMETNVSEIANQIKQLKPLGGKNLVLMGSIGNVANYLLQAKSDMTMKAFNWFIVTKDPQQFICKDCVTTNTFWIRPYVANVSAYSNVQFEQFRNGTSIQPPFDEVDKLALSFFFDVTNFAWTYMKAVPGNYPTYSCSSNSFGSATASQTISKMIDTLDFGSGTLGMKGIYGNYQTDTSEVGNYYQDVYAKIQSIAFDDKSKLINDIGDWTPTKQINDAFGLLENVASVKNYRIVVVVQKPFVIKLNKTDENNNPIFEGYCIDLIKKIRDEMNNFNYTIYEPADGQYGALNDNNEWTGMIGELVSGHADIAVGALSVTAERESFVDFTVPYYDLVGTTILMRKPDEDYDLFKFMSVLEYPVWGCIVGAYFFTSILLWLFDKFSPYSFTNNKDKYKDDPEQREFNFKECLWFCMTSLTPQGGGEAPKNISGRLVAATWWLFGFIIIASYTANLAAFLTVSRLETQITSLDDLAKQYKVKYAPVRGTSSETYFKRMADIENKFYDIWKAMSLNESMTPQQRAQLAVWDYPVSDKFNNMWRYMQEAGLPNTTAEAIERVLKSPGSSTADTGDPFAFIGDATEIRYAALTNCFVQMIGSEFSRKPYAIAVQQLSPLKEQISSAILKLLNNRELEQLKDLWWNQNKEKKVCAKADDESDGISIKNIGGVFIVILIGIVLSVITLAFEYWYYRDKRRLLKEQKAQQKRDQVDNVNVNNQDNNRDNNQSAIGLGVFSGNYDTKH